MPSLELDKDALARFRKKAFIDEDQALAFGMGVSPATVSRVLSGEIKPSNQFIAGLLDLFGHAWFNELFKVVR